jgi:3D (Asp-Asp-Asp) domain-containing protein
MKNLARGSVVLSVLALAMSFMYSQQNVEAALFQANNSQTEKTNKTTNIQTNSTNHQETNISESNDDDKLVKKTVSVRKTGVGAYRATAYCLKGRTATGGGVRRGIVAADTRVLPLGTRIFLNAGPYSGTYTVTDTGGAIRGRILDVWVPSCSEANRFGRKSVSVTILGR